LTDLVVEHTVSNWLGHTALNVTLGMCFDLVVPKSDRRIAVVAPDVQAVASHGLIGHSASHECSSTFIPLTDLVDSSYFEVIASVSLQV